LKSKMTLRDVATSVKQKLMIIGVQKTLKLTLSF